jgi:hypothetical protein
MKRPSQFVLCIALSALLDASLASGQNPLVTEGRIAIDGKFTPYLIRRLPVSSFPDLPAPIQAALNQRGCLIPQTYQAHRPENVVHASLESGRSSDWAVLCSAKGSVSLLVFFASAKEGTEPIVLASAPEMDRLEAHGADNVLGFNWGIDAANPAQVHEAQAGLAPRPMPLDHDALADETIDQRTVYRFYARGAWRLLDMPVP